MHYKFLQYFITSNGNTCLQNGLYIHEINPNTEHLHFKKCFSSRIVMALWLKSLPLYATYENISLYMGWICTSGIYIQQLFLFYWLSARHRKYDPGVGQCSSVFSHKTCDLKSEWRTRLPSIHVQQILNQYQAKFPAIYFATAGCYFMYLIQQVKK